jgi:hypothetical protein
VDLARAQFNPIRETPFARTAAQSRTMTRRCVFGPAAVGARERISDDAGVPAGPVFLREAAAQKSQRARAPQRGTTAAAA